MRITWTGSNRRGAHPNSRGLIRGDVARTVLLPSYRIILYSSSETRWFVFGSSPPSASAWGAHRGRCWVHVQWRNLNWLNALHLFLGLTRNMALRISDNDTGQMEIFCVTLYWFYELIVNSLLCLCVITNKTQTPQSKHFLCSTFRFKIW